METIPIFRERERKYFILFVNLNKLLCLNINVNLEYYTT